jgi:hypothetical protein
MGIQTHKMTQAMRLEDCTQSSLRQPCVAHTIQDIKKDIPIHNVLRTDSVYIKTVIQIVDLNNNSYRINQYMFIICLCLISNA